MDGASQGIFMDLTDLYTESGQKIWDAGGRLSFQNRLKFLEEVHFDGSIFEFLLVLSSLNLMDYASCDTDAHGRLWC